MKRYLKMLFGITLFLLSGCSKEESSSDPTLQDTIEIDLNEDGSADYNVKYSSVDIEPLTISGGTFGLEGRIHPIGINEMLRKVGSSTLFLRNLEEINEVVESPLEWRSSFSRTIVSINTINDKGDWPNEWEINSDSNHSTHYIGLKIVSDTEIQLGWIEIEINTTDGSVSIIDKGIL